MTMKTMALAGLAATTLAAGAAQAQQAPAFRPKAAHRLIVDLRVTDVAPAGEDAVTTLAGAPTGLSAKVGDSVMPTLGLTWFFTDHIAAEVIAGTTKHTVKARGPGLDVDVKDTWVLPPVVSLQYHFFPKARFSPYVGAGVNYMIFYNGKNLDGFHLKLENGFGAAVQAGADYAIAGPWSANLDVKKIFFETDAHDDTAGIESKVHLDPWVVSAGIGYRF